MEYERQTDRRRDGFKNSKHNPSRIYSLANVRNPYAQFSIIMALISGRVIRLLTADWRIAIISTAYQFIVGQIIKTTVCYVYTYVIQLAVIWGKLRLSEGITPQTDQIRPDYASLKINNVFHIIINTLFPRTMC